MNQLKNFRYLLIAISILIIIGLVGVGLVNLNYIRQGRPLCPLNFPSLTSTARDDELTLELTDNALIPRPEDWIDYGPILEGGPEGDWDFRPAGITPASVIKKEDTYYFYYVGSDGYRSHDGGPRHRSIGVAVSEDGIHYSRYQSNPIVTHSPFNGEEEGANSAGVTLSSSGEFIMYYGAAEGPGDLIVADGRIAVSSDGLNFTDDGEVIDHCDNKIYGYGDEIFPVATFESGNTWYVYYSINGKQATRGTMGVAWGSAMNELSNSEMLLDSQSGELPVNIWGNIVPISEEVVALFIQHAGWPNSYVEVRLAPHDRPYLLSDPITRYDIPNLKRGVIFLDEERRTWFMYYNDFYRFWNVKLAAAGERDLSPPSKPVNLSAQGKGDGSINLVWEPATDLDTGIIQYNIYRDGQKLGSAKEWSFVDTKLDEITNYEYEVAAVNLHGTEGQPATIWVATPEDTVRPTIDKVIAQEDPTKMQVYFSEKLEKASAEDPNNYSISNNVHIKSAQLESAGKLVTLTTSPLQMNDIYTIKVSNVRDGSSNLNVIEQNTSVVFNPISISGQVGYWPLKGLEIQKEKIIDASGNQHDAVSTFVRNSPGFLYFDGDNDFIRIENYPGLKEVTNDSFTFSVWARPEILPDSKNGFGVVLKVGDWRAAVAGILFDREGRYLTQIIDEREATVSAQSQPTNAGEWHSATMVVDADTKTLYLYFDGDLVGDGVQKYEHNLLDFNHGAGKNHSAGDYYVGSTKPDSGGGSFYDRHFKGYIGNVRIFDHALSAEEVKTLYEHERLTLNVTSN